MRCKLHRLARCDGGGRDHLGGERGPYDLHWVEHRSRRRHGRLGLDRATHLRSRAARVRQVHARQRRADLRRPQARRRGENSSRKQSGSARVQCRAGEVRRARAGQRPSRLGAPSLRRDDGEAAPGRPLHTPARRLPVPRPTGIDAVQPQPRAGPVDLPTTRERSSCSRAESTCSRRRSNKRLPRAAAPSSPTTNDGTQPRRGQHDGQVPAPRIGIGFARQLAVLPGD